MLRKLFVPKLVLGFAVLVVMSVVAVGDSRGSRGARGVSGYTVEVAPVASFHPRGASFPISFTLSNGADQPLGLLFDAAGSPVYGLLHLENASGFGYGTPAPIRDRLRPPEPGFPQSTTAEAYQVKSGEALSFVIDLATIVDLEKAPAGEYRVSFETQADTFAAGSFTLVDFRRVDPQSINGSFHPMLQQAGDAATFEASVRLSIAQSEGLDEEMAWLLVDRVNAFGREQTDLPSYAIVVPVGSQVERVEMDHRGQVWVLVKSGDRQSLYVWTMSDLGWSVLVSPTVQELRFGTTWAHNGNKQKIVVIAGLEGDALYTTHSVFHRRERRAPREGQKSEGVQTQVSE